MSLETLALERLQTFITRSYEGKASDTEAKLAALDLGDVRRELMRLQTSERFPEFDAPAPLLPLIVGMVGYHTPDGLSGDEWANPPHLRRLTPEQQVVE